MLRSTVNEKPFEGLGEQIICLFERGDNSRKQDGSRIPWLRIGSMLYIADCYGRKAREKKAVQLLAM